MRILQRAERVGFGEEAGDLAPAGPFAGLARFADENDEEIEAVTRGPDAAVQGGADEAAEGRQELEEDGGGIGLSMWGKCTDEETGNTVESRAGQCRRWGRGLSGWKLVGCGESLRGLLAGLVSKQLSTPLYGGECWQRAGRVEWVLSECDDMKLPRFWLRGSKLRVSHPPSEALCEA